jgi:hypothetical protein
MVGDLVIVPPSGEDRGLHPRSLELVELWTACEQSCSLEGLDRLLSTRDPFRTGPKNATALMEVIGVPTSPPTRATAVSWLNRIGAS